MPLGIWPERDICRSQKIKGHPGAHSNLPRSTSLFERYTQRRGVQIMQNR